MVDNSCGSSQALVSVPSTGKKKKKKRKKKGGSRKTLVKFGTVMHTCDLSHPMSQRFLKDDGMV